MYSHNHATVAQINAYRDEARARFAGMGFRIDSNAYGLRAECERCRNSNTADPERFMRHHACPTAPTGVRREADWTEETVNADGSRNLVLHYL